MRRLILALGLVCAACLGARADEDKKEEGFKGIRAEFLKKFRAADADGKKEAFKEYGPKFLGIADKEGKSEDAFGSVMFLLQIAKMSDDKDLMGKTVALLKKNHLGNKNFAAQLPMVTQMMGSEGEPFVKELMEKGETDGVKAAAVSYFMAKKETELSRAKGDAAAKITKEMAELRKIGAKVKMRDLFVGGTLPDLKSENLDGKEEKLSQYKGKVVVLDIWATWCPPCRAMIPHERELVERLKDKPFALISISFDDEKETLTKFLEKEKMPWVHWWNGRKGDLGEQLSITAFPTIFVLDAKGVIRYKGVRGKAMDAAVDALLKEMAEEKKSS